MRQSLKVCFVVFITVENKNGLVAIEMSSELESSLKSWKTALLYIRYFILFYFILGSRKTATATEILQMAAETSNLAIIKWREKRTNVVSLQKELEPHQNKTKTNLEKHQIKNRNTWVRNENIIN